jgi:hypothetical protein
LEQIQDSGLRNRGRINLLGGINENPLLRRQGKNGKGLFTRNFDVNSLMESQWTCTHTPHRGLTEKVLTVSPQRQECFEPGLGNQVDFVIVEPIPKPVLIT